MRIHVLLVFLVTSTFYIGLFSHPRKTTDTSTKKDHTAQTILANFANIAMSIIAMGSNPYDKTTLMQGGCNIVASLTNIAQEAFKLIDKEELKRANREELSQILYKKLHEIGLPEQIAEYVSTNAAKKRFLQHI